MDMEMASRFCEILGAKYAVVCGYLNFILGKHRYINGDNNF